MSRRIAAVTTTALLLAVVMAAVLSASFVTGAQAARPAVVAADAAAADRAAPPSPSSSSSLAAAAQEGEANRRRKRRHHHHRRRKPKNPYSSPLGLFIQERASKMLPGPGQHFSFGALQPWEDVLALLREKDGKRSGGRGACFSVFSFGGRVFFFAVLLQLAARSPARSSSIPLKSYSVILRFC